MTSRSMPAVLIALGLSLADPTAAVVIRHDLSESLYLDLADAYPSVGAIQLPNTLCSGTLVTASLVLTAAHCVDPNGTNVSSVSPASAFFRLGADVSHPLSITPVGAIFVNSWSGAVAMDMALLQLANPIPSTSAVPLLINPFTTFDRPGTPGDVGVIAGFGQDGNGLNPASGVGIRRAGTNFIYLDAQLRPDVLLFDFDRPDGSTGPDGLPLPSTMGQPWLEAMSCSGDSGGPLMSPAFPSSANPLATGQIVGVLSSELVISGSGIAHCAYGSIGEAAWVGLGANLNFLTAHGVPIEFGRADEPASLALLGIALGSLSLARQFARPRRSAARVRERGLVGLTP